MSAARECNQTDPSLFTSPLVYRHTAVKTSVLTKKIEWEPRSERTCLRSQNRTVLPTRDPNESAALSWMVTNLNFLRKSRGDTLALQSLSASV